MASEKMVSKVTLSSGKVVLLREVQIKHTDLAAQAAAQRAGDNANLLMVYMQKEFLKLLICKIDDKIPTMAELENLDDLFSFVEYGQLSSVIKKLTGGDDMGKPPTVDLVPFGSK